MHNLLGENEDDLSISKLVRILHFILVVAINEVPICLDIGVHGEMAFAESK